jgi:RNA-directed DNA polymerase
MLSHLAAWFRRLFGLSERRTAVRLPSGEPTADGRPADVVHEEIRRRGPLRPNHRRQIIRDERLMPKAPRRESWTKPPKVMSADEATRLFAGTLRTGNRELRTLATDEAQLQRHGLPLWRSEADLAAALGLSIGQLRGYSTHRQRDRVCHYVSYGIPKRSGGVRIIHAPKQRLKRILRALHRELVSKLPVSEHAHGFRKGRSVKTCAQPHVGKPFVLRLDLKDFFPSVTWARVRGLLVSLGYGYPVAATLAVLMTEAARQPVVVDSQTYFVPVGPRTCVQGAPTSPGLCNAILLRMDRRIAGLAKKHGFAYTRYADDLIFSGDSARTAHRLRRSVERVISEEGFSVNPVKTRLAGQGGRQEVAGVTVNSVLGLSRQKRRRIRAMLHAARTTPTGDKRRAELAGLLAWVHMLNPEQAEKLRKGSERPGARPTDARQP